MQFQKVQSVVLPPIGHARPTRVLIVDDSKLQRKILTSSLSRLGYEVFEAASGIDALMMCQKTPPEVVISDWMMPGMSGLEFCKAFRDLTAEDYTYFILLTAKSGTPDVAKGLDAGAEDFLTKPVHAQELRARITAGERVVTMQRELTEKNRLISDTLSELKRLYSSLDSDLIEAKKLQQSLVPERQQRVDGADVSLILRSSGHVGGDLVGMFPAEPGHVGLYAIDVSGHGISSALMTARVAGYLSATALDQNVALRKDDDGTYRFRKPSDVIETMNDLVLDEMKTEHYFTMILADVDLMTGRVRMAQAGHPYPLVQRSDGRIEQFGPGGFPVGLMSGISFEDFEVQLAAGDRLLLLSDGVTECPGDDNELLSEEGLAKIAAELFDMRGHAFFEAMIWRLSEFSGADTFPDDISGVLLEYGGHV